MSINIACYLRAPSASLLLSTGRLVFAGREVTKRRRLAIGRRCVEKVTRRVFLAAERMNAFARGPAALVLFCFTRPRARFPPVNERRAASRVANKTVEMSRSRRSSAFCRSTWTPTTACRLLSLASYMRGSSPVTPKGRANLFYASGSFFVFLEMFALSCFDERFCCHLVSANLTALGFEYFPRVSLFLPVCF